MILGIDIGNSTIAFGLIDKGRVVRVCKIEHEPDSELFLPKLRNFLEHLCDKHKIEQSMICSVVPKATVFLNKEIQRVLGHKALVIGKDIRIPIVNQYKSPRQVGQDRLLCAFGARELYGTPVIVIDSGTAITFDVISPTGDYLGGAIIPGLRLSAEALFEKTALLPRVHIDEPKHVIGRTTEESIQSGLFHGYGALCDGMIKRLAQVTTSATPGAGKVAKVVMTGGHAELLSKYLTHPVAAVDQELIFKAMALL